MAKNALFYFYSKLKENLEFTLDLEMAKMPWVFQSKPSSLIIQSYPLCLIYT